MTEIKIEDEAASINIHSSEGRTTIAAFSTYTYVVLTVSPKELDELIKALAKERDKEKLITV